MPHFVITARDGTETDVQIDEAFFSIGRSPSCTIQIKDRTLSKQHVKFFRTRYGYYVVDVGSRNGTAVNGSKISEHLLHPGDRIVMGKIKVRWIGDEGKAGPPVASASIVAPIEQYEVVRVEKDVAPPPPRRSAAPAREPVLEVVAEPILDDDGGILPAFDAPPVARGPLPFLEAADDVPAGFDAIDGVLARLRKVRETAGSRFDRWGRLAARLATAARARGGRPASIAASIAGGTLFLILTARYAVDARWDEPKGLVLASEADEGGRASSDEDEDDAREALSQAHAVADADPVGAGRALRAYLDSHPGSPRRSELEAEIDRLDRRAALASTGDAGRVEFARGARDRGELLLALEAYRLLARSSAREEERRAFERECADLESVLRTRYVQERVRLVDLARLRRAEEARMVRDELVRRYPLPDLIQDADQLLAEALGPTTPADPPAPAVDPERRADQAEICRQVREQLRLLQHPEAIALLQLERDALAGTDLARFAELVESESKLLELARKNVSEARPGILPAGTVTGRLAAGKLIGLDDAGITILVGGSKRSVVGWKDIDEHAIFQMVQRNLPKLTPDIYLMLAAWCALRDWEADMKKNIDHAAVRTTEARERGEAFVAFHRAYSLLLQRKR